jgi:hypothetical protein
VTQQHRDPAPVPGVHLVKTTSREEDSLASDCVDILRDGLRGGTDCDVGGVEETQQTTLEADELARTEHEFYNALARRVRERCPWVDGHVGLGVSELGERNGWRFQVRDREGRPFEVEFTYSNIREIALRQRRNTVSNFRAVLDLVCDKLGEERAKYFARRDAVELH